MWARHRETVWDSTPDSWFLAVRANRLAEGLAPRPEHMIYSDGTVKCCTDLNFFLFFLLHFWDAMVTFDLSG